MIEKWGTKLSQNSAIPKKEPSDLTEVGTGNS